MTPTVIEYYGKCHKYHHGIYMYYLTQKTVLVISTILVVETVGAQWAQEDYYPVQLKEC